MPTKPSKETVAAYEVASKDPDFARKTLEAIINETPELRDALLEHGLVEETR